MFDVIQKVYSDCKAELRKPKAEMHNCVREVYEPFTVEDINARS
jgi:amidophosphoribosyltransferase